MNNSLVTGIYECLRERLLMGCYPSGAHLDYKRISCELHVSTTPMREAFARLAGDGLVELIPRSGARVRRFASDEFGWLFEVREALELYAFRHAAQRLTATRLAAMEQLMEQMQRQAAAQVATVTTTYGWNCTEFRKMDLAFHLNIVAMAGNQQLVRIAENALVLTWLACGEWLESQQAQIQINAAHKAIYEAFRARNDEQVLQACRQHLRDDLGLTIEGQKSQAILERFSAANINPLKIPRPTLKSRRQYIAPQNEFKAIA